MLFTRNSIGSEINPEFQQTSYTYYARYTCTSGNMLSHLIQTANFWSDFYGSLASRVIASPTRSKKVKDMLELTWDSYNDNDNV